MAQTARARTQYISTGATLPATALAQIQANIDTNGYCEIGYSAGGFQQLAGTINLGSNQVLVVPKEFGLQWTSALGNNCGVQNKTIAPADLAAYDVGPRVIGGGKLLGPWNGTDFATQGQTAVQWIACREPHVEAVLDGWQGDGVYHGSKSGSVTLYTYGATTDVVVRNILRNGVTFTEGEGFDVRVRCLIDPATGRGCGLQVLDCEPNNVASVIRDGRFYAYANGGGAGPLGGSSYIAAFSDKNSGTCRNITGEIVGRGGAYSGLYYRGVLGLTAKVSVEDLGGHGIQGGNGAARASRVTLTADIGVKSGTAFNGWVDTSENTVAEVLAMKVRQPNNVNPIAVRSAAGGTWSGIDVTMTGAGYACINADNCTEVEMIAPRTSGGTYGIEFDDGHGASTHNKVRGATILATTAGAVREISTCDYNEFYNISAEGSFPGVTLTGVHSFRSENRGAYAVANLPSASSLGKGARAYATDSNATLAAGIGNTVAGGGANNTPLVSDGTNWKIG